MKSLTIILLMLSLQAVMGLSLRDIPKCSVPRKFEGKFKGVVTSGSTPGDLSTYNSTNTVHIDDTIRKKTISDRTDHSYGTSVGNTTHSNHSIYFTSYLEPFMGSIRCFRMDWGSNIMPGDEVPPGVTIDIKKGVLQGVPVQIWEYSNVPGRNVTWYLTEDKCMPVKREEKKEFVGFPKWYGVFDYYDMKEGISDASVFDVPSNCSNPLDPKTAINGRV